MSITQITQETASLVEALARAASQIGSTDASKKINQLIVDLLPPSTDKASIEEMVTQLQTENSQLTIDVNAYRISNEMRGESLQALRSAMAQIEKISTEALEAVGDVDVNEYFGNVRMIIALSAQDPQPEQVED